MPIPFVCPHCGVKMQVDAAYAGQSGPCSGCGQKIQIPSVAEALPPVGPYGHPENRPSGGFGAGLVLAALVCLFLLCGGILFPLLMVVRKSAISSIQSQNNLKRIAIALHNYHEIHGSLPPAYVADSEGMPLYSWRVLILPYLGHDVIWQRWDKSKAWNSPENIALAESLVPIYSANASAEACNYVVPTGPNTAFPGATSVKLADVTDGTSNTIAVIELRAAELRGLGPSWAAPVDLDADNAAALARSGAAQVVMLDGSVMSVQGNVAPFMTIAGGEPVGPGRPVSVATSTVVNGRTVVVVAPVPEPAPPAVVAPAPETPSEVAPVPVEEPAVPAKEADSATEGER